MFSLSLDQVVFLQQFEPNRVQTGGLAIVHLCFIIDLLSVDIRQYFLPWSVLSSLWIIAGV